MSKLPVRILSVALALAVLLAPMHHALAQANNPYLDAAMRLYADLEYEKALEQLNKAGSFPGNSIAQDVQINLYSGLIKLELGDKTGAESDFKTALALDPEVKLPGKQSPKIAEVFEKARADIVKARPPKPAVAEPVALPPPVAVAPVQPVQPVQPPPPAVPPPALTTPKPVQQTVVITTPSPEAKERLVAAAPPAEAPPSVVKTEKKGGVGVLPFVLMGIGVGLGGGGAYFGVKSAGSVDAAKGAAFQSDAATHLNDARAQAFTANVMYGAAGAAVLAGIVALIASSGGSEEPAKSVAVE